MKNKWTNGPWRWFACHITKSVYLARVDPRYGGRDYVMDFVRYGMDGAAPCFSVDSIMKRVDEMSPHDHNGEYEIEHIDARIIAASPEMLEVLIGILKSPHENSEAMTKAYDVVHGIVGDDIHELLKGE